MVTRGQAIVGRDRELAVLSRFLEGVPHGPVALLIQGEAGIGKTTLWQSGTARARELGLEVLAARGGQSEAQLSFAALGDLLAPVVDQTLPDLPVPQRDALEVALLRVGTSGPPPDPRAVSLGTLGVLRAAAASTPLLLSIDDLQWLDPSSARVVEFCARRIQDESIRLFASVRLGGSDPSPWIVERAIPGGLERLAVGPMPADELGRIIRAGLGADLPHPLVQRVHAAAAGNPFFALEIAREILRDGTPAAGEALRVPHDLTELLRARVVSLPKTTRDALLVAASTARPTRRTIRYASGLDERTDPALARAESAGVVNAEGDEIRFAHPLFASTVYASASVAEKRAVHARLAACVDDPEERARHLALGSAGPDPTISSALDDAAGRARARGAPDSAAELTELARRLTPAGDVDALGRRTVQAAEYHFEAGDAARSMTLFEEAISAAEPGRDRARILFGLASRSWMDLRRVQELCEAALEEADGDSELRSAILEHLAWVGIYRGDLASASKHAKASTEPADASSDPRSQAEALATSGMVEFLMGRPAETLMLEADRLQELGETASPGLTATVYTGARTSHGLQLLWAGELHAARQILRRELDGYEKRGLYLIRDEPLGYLAELECRAGNWDVAATCAQEAYEIEVESGRLWGQGHTLFNKALVAAHRGDVDAARSDAGEGLRISIGNDDPFYENCNRGVLGFLELSLGNAAAAHEHLEPVIRYIDRMGSAEPGILTCVPDEVEALVALGRLDEAGSILDGHEAKGRARDRPWALATTGRCRGLLLAARGDPSEAIETLDQALREHERVPQPFELGRTLLVKGEVERRAKQKRSARTSIEAAHALFQRLGAPLWSTKALAALERVGGAAGAGELTPTEIRVAELVAAGKTNREVADALFISVKTVEANLSRIFHKLGVRSRTELTRKLLPTGSQGPVSGA